MKNIAFQWKVNVLWPLAYRLRSLFKPSSLKKIPEGQSYEFDKAKDYWLNVPRSGGGLPFNTLQLMQLSDEELLEAFDKEAALARIKDERKAGFLTAEKNLEHTTNPAVLDYGSGMGFYGFEILSRRKDAHVTFCDINESNLKTIERMARLKGLQSRVDCCLVKDMKARDLSFETPFDFMISMGVLHHSPFASEIVDRLSSFLKPGGKFQVMLYNHEFLKSMERVSGKKLDASGFGMLSDPEAKGLINPYSEAYDHAKTEKLFTGFELLGSLTPMPFYTIYTFQKAMVR